MGPRGFVCGPIRPSCAVRFRRIWGAGLAGNRTGSRILPLLFSGKRKIGGRDFRSCMTQIRSQVGST